MKVGATYAPEDGSIVATSTFLSGPDESDAVRRAAYGDSLDWYAGIIDDMFG